MMETPKKSTVQLNNLLKIHEFQYEKIEAFVVDSFPYSKSKHRDYLIPRQALMIYMRYCGMGPTKIAGIFEKNHSAVINTFKVFDGEVYSGFGLILEEFIKLVEKAHAFIPLQNLDDIGLLEYCSLAQLDTYFFKGEKTDVQSANRPFKNMLLNVIVLCKNNWDFHSYIKIYNTPNKKYYRLCCCADIKDSFFNYDDVVRTSNFEEEEFDRPRMLEVFLEEFRESKNKN